MQRLFLDLSPALISATLIVYLFFRWELCTVQYYFICSFVVHRILPVFINHGRHIWRISVFFTYAAEYILTCLIFFVPFSS